MHGNLSIPYKYILTNAELVALAEIFGIQKIEPLNQQFTKIYGYFVARVTKTSYVYRTPSSL